MGEKYYLFIKVIIFINLCDKRSKTNTFRQPTNDKLLPRNI